MQKYNWAKINIKPEVKREIDILAATAQRPVYELVADMVANYKVSSIDELPHPDGAQSVPVVSMSRS